MPVTAIGAAEDGDHVPMVLCPYVRADARQAWEEGYRASKAFDSRRRQLTARREELSFADLHKVENPYLSEGTTLGRARAWEDGWAAATKRAAKTKEIQSMFGTGGGQ